MTPEEHARMNQLCILIQDEKDHHEFLNLVRELNDLLERKEYRLGPREAPHKAH